MAAVAVAAPEKLAAAATLSDERSDDFYSPILRDDRIREDDGRFNFDVETGNGIVLSQSGSPEGDAGAVIKAGQYS